MCVGGRTPGLATRVLEPLDHARGPSIHHLCLSLSLCGPGSVILTWQRDRFPKCLLGRTKCGHGAESCGVLCHCFSEREEPHCPTGIPAGAEEKVQGGAAAPTRSVGWEPGLGVPSVCPWSLHCLHVPR